MNEKFHREDTLQKIVVNEEVESHFFCYKPEWKILGLILRKEEVIGKSRWLKYNSYFHFIKEGKVYDKAEVVLYFLNGHSEIIHFNSNQEAHDYASTLKSKLGTSWLDVSK